jgi:signal transduction histidine kinase
VISENQYLLTETTPANSGDCLPILGMSSHGPAPSGRSTRQELEWEARLLRSSPLVQAAFNAMPLGVAVLNRHRQIVLANQKLLGSLDCAETEALGKRPGEALGCIQCTSGIDGCGTAKACHVCGAVAAILESQRGAEAVVRDCRIAVTRGDMFELRVTASPLHVGGAVYTIFSAQDISAENRLDALTRSFFHDVLNTAGVVRGFADFMLTDGPDRECLESLQDASGRLLHEIEAHRDLIHGEKGELQVRCEPVDAQRLLRTLAASYAKHPASAQRAIDLGDSWQGMIRTDPRLLLRVLGNMLKNALEATPPRGRVRVECREADAAVVFSVHNQAVMSDEVQLQIFHRSFSTKARHGRGLGTFSMKLLGQRYLGGRVSFTSRAPEGTVFCLELPKDGPTETGSQKRVD